MNSVSKEGFGCRTKLQQGSSNRVDSSIGISRNFYLSRNSRITGTEFQAFPTRQMPQKDIRS
jgi:hypothetical protein